MTPSGVKKTAADGKPPPPVARCLLPWVPLCAPALASWLPLRSRTGSVSLKIVVSACRQPLRLRVVLGSPADILNRRSRAPVGGDGGSLAQLPPGEKPPTTGRATAEDASLRLSEHQPLAGASNQPGSPSVPWTFCPDRHHRGCGAAKVKIWVILALLSEEGQPVIGH